MEDHPDMGYSEWIVSIPLGRKDYAAYLGPRRIIVRASSEAHARTRGAAQLGVDEREVAVDVNPGPDGTGDIQIIPGPYGG